MTKNIGIGLLILAAILAEINFLIIWYLPNMDIEGLTFIYCTSFFARLIIYSLILTGYDYLWVKYITHNTKQYRQGLIKLYENQVYCEPSAYMVTALHKAIEKLQSGENPTDVEDFVVRMEKEFRS